MYAPIGLLLLYSPSYHSEKAHVPLSLPEVSTVQLPWHTLEIRYSSSMLHYHIVLGVRITMLSYRFLYAIKIISS